VAIGIAREGIDKVPFLVRFRAVHDDHITAISGSGQTKFHSGINFYCGDRARTPHSLRYATNTLRLGISSFPQLGFELW
jgi:hypothetical protein